MKKGRSEYTFKLNYDTKLVKNLIESFIQGNNFELQRKNDEEYYRAGDAVVQGYRYFKYSISGQTLTIYAWLKGVFGDVKIERNSLNMPAMTYRNSLNTLFEELSKLNNEDVKTSNNNDIGSDKNIQENQNNISEFNQRFKDETIKKQETMCEVGFWLSLLGLICSLLGLFYSVIVYILDFYFASQGLKTKKRKKAILTIFISIISIVIIIITLINA